MTKKLSLLIFIIVAVLYCPAQNLLKNGSFEELSEAGIFSGWSYSPRQMAVSRDAFQGRNSVSIKLVRPDEHKIYGQALAQDLHPTPGAEYRLSFHGKVVGDGALWSSWAFYDKAGKRIDVPLYWSGNIKAGGDWRRVEQIVKIPDGTAKMRFSIRHELTAPDFAGTGLLDAVSFEQIGSADQRPEDAKLLYQESFSEKSLVENWDVRRGKWRSENGVFYAEGPDARLFFKGELSSPNLRLEFTAWSPEPCDLSAWLNGEVLANGRCDGYFFGFGSENNSKNSISRGSKVFASRGGTWDSLVDKIKPDTKHRIVVQRNYEKLTLAVDGKLLLEGADLSFSEMLQAGLGFYVWTKAYISDIQIFALPYAGGAVTEKTLTEERKWLFQSADFSGMRCSPETQSELINIPTYVMKCPDKQTLHANKLELAEMGSVRVDDNALKLKGNPKFQADFNTGKLASGIVEMDLFAEEYGELSLQILDSDENLIQQLNIDQNGTFYSGLRKLRDNIRWARRRYDAPLKFASGRWHTFRLKFDCQSGLTEISLRDYYTELKNAGWPEGNRGDSIILDSAAGSATANDAAILRVVGSGTVYLDNLLIFGPIGISKVNGKRIELPARELLNLSYPLRRDPISLKNFRFRHFPDPSGPVYLGYYTPIWWLYLNKKNPKHEIFRPAAKVYNEILLQSAFMEENLSFLRRRAFYRGDAKLGSALLELDNSYAQLEAYLEKALAIYADAWWNDWNESDLAAIFPLCAQLCDDLDKINQQIKTFYGAAAELCPVPLSSGKLAWNFESKFWEQGGVPVVWPYSGYLYPGFQEDAEMLGFPKVKWWGACRIHSDSSEPGHFVDQQYHWYHTVKKSPDYEMGAALVDGEQYPNMMAPAWWLEKHKNDSDLFLCNANGKVFNESFNRAWQLNFFNPAVKEMMRHKYSEIGRYISEYRQQFLYVNMGTELKNVLPDGSRPGYNKSAVAELQNVLANKYQTIDQLNLAWHSDFQDFSQILPPKRSGVPSGLQYEFNKFYQESFAGWLRSARSSLQAVVDIPFASDQQETLGGFVNIEPISFFEAVDIKLYHTYQDWDRKVVDRWHHQLCAVLGKGFGTLEWGHAQGSPYMFEYEGIAVSAKRELFQQMMWGAAMVNSLYSIGYGNWQYAPPTPFEATLDYTIFSYGARAMAVAHERLRRFAKVALTAQTVDPEIGILESSSSYFNNLPVRQGMNYLTSALAEASWDYAILYEKLIVEQRQSLDKLKFLWLPSGKCLQAEFRQMLFKWVENGGILAASNQIPGLLNQYGQPVGDYPLANQDESSEWSCQYGKGEIIFLPRPPQNVAELQSKYSSKRFGSDNLHLQFRLCKKGDDLYLFAVNWSEETQTAEIFVPGRVGVVDMGLPLPEKVAGNFSSGKTSFSTRLAPGAGTLFLLKQD